MPIKGIPQPDLLQIDDTLRLRKYDGNNSLALEWYQDPEMVYLVDGVRQPYTLEKLTRMYHYLEQQGELYWIEICRDGQYTPIGDVTFWQEDLPIVIGDPACRGRQIGRKVINALAERARALGYDYICVNQIYHDNHASQKCFQSAGFVQNALTEKGISMIRNLKEA